ncbi:hypothetical protein PGT21_027300 [Puccinia graminis f. sp. tritici]|uniref:Uncharacterized protein n=1 Tax=Puccinia graminis f. sp. tritici TaxID=56615 RepID=A0A5B0S4A0_PUCGR|nr:hypothetical protein PGT21_027300 [Puccinia graminis f. sp. tritici]KAA1132961.1 hypothetical protein PGTUg99_012334 [Puccinia graminis f. sp. tritici]
MNSLANKVSVIGFGTVVNRSEVTTTTPGNATNTNLHVTVQHYDYDNLAKEKIEFHATYIVPSNKILGKTFIQFVVGHEIVIDAHVHGYNEDTNRWEFIVGGMAHPSNQAPTPVPTPAQSTPASNQSRRPGFKQIGGFHTPATNSGSPIASGSGSTPSTSGSSFRDDMSPIGKHDFHRGTLFTGTHTVQPPEHQLMSPPRHDPTEDGEVTEPAPSPHVGNSFGSKGPKRASELSILKEAGKRSKNLP